MNINTLLERFSDLLTHVRGPTDVIVQGINMAELASDQQIIFVGDKKFLNAALASKSRMWIATQEVVDLAPPDITLLLTRSISLAIARIGQEAFPILVNKQPFDRERIHPSAIIHPTAKIGKDVIIGPYAVIGEGAVIGDESIIGSQSTIEPFVEIGPRCHIHPQVFIAHHCVLGPECEVHPQTSIGTEGFGYAHDGKGRYHRMVHYGRVVIGRRVHIGAGVNMDRGTFKECTYGDNIIIDNHCHFAHNTTVGPSTIVTAGFIVGGSTDIGGGCVFGGRASVSGHIKISDRCTFAGVSTINSSIDKPGEYGGNPVEPLRASRRTLASLPHVPKLRKQVSRILKRLGMDDTEQGSEA